jgi:hypothetical protein
MSLDHDFLLVAAAEHSPAEYGRFIRHPIATYLHDDLLHYVGDSLRWIPTQPKAERRESDALQCCHWTISLLKRWLLDTHASGSGGGCDRP